MGLFHLMSQTLSESAINKELSLISDSIDNYLMQGDEQKVYSICKNGIDFLLNNDLFYTPASCALYLLAGESCMNLQDYSNAKFYYYNSFILDEWYGFGIDTYAAIVKRAESDVNISYFKELLELAKSDTTFLQNLALEPNEIGYRFNKTAWEYCNKGEYSSALYFFEMEINLLDALGQTGSDNYLSIIPCEILCMRELGNYNGAIDWANYYLGTVNFYKGNKTIEYAYALQTKADVENHFGNSIEAIELYNESLSLIENIKGKNDIDYIRCLRELGTAYEHSDNNCIKRLEIELEVEKLLALTPDATIDDKVYNFNNLSHLYYRIGDNVKHLSYAEKAVILLETGGQIDNADYAGQLNTLTGALCANHYYDKAIEVGEKSVRVYSQVDRTAMQDIMYRQSIRSLASAYFEYGSMDKAISVIQPLLTDEFPDDEHKLTAIQTMFTWYDSVWDIKKMKETCLQSLSLAEKIGGKESELYARALILASEIQEKEGDKILMLQEAADIYLRMYGENSQEYINTQQALSLSLLGLDDEKEEKFDFILDKYKILYGENSRQYLREYIYYLWNISKQYQKQRDIDNVYLITLQLDSLSRNIHNHFSEKDDLYLYARHNLAELITDCYTMTLDSTFYDWGVGVQNEVLLLASSLYGENNIKYINEITHLVDIKGSIIDLYYLTHSEESSRMFDLYSINPNDASEVWKYYETTSISKCYAEIQELLSRVIDYYVQVGGKGCLMYAHACEKLANYYYQEINEFPIRGLLLFYKPDDVVRVNLNLKYNKAEQLYKEVLDIYMGLMELKSAANVLQDLNFLYESSNDESKSASALVESFKLWKEDVLIQMSLMTSDEKSQMVFDNFWQSRIGYYNRTAYWKSKKDNYDSKYLELSYDVQLLSKGLLLKSEIGLRDLILSKGDSAVINKFNRLTEIKGILSNPSDEINREALLKEFRLLERLLMKESELYGNYLQEFSYTFADVKSSLGKKEVAIEFVSFPTSVLEEDNAMYCALILKKGYKSPRMVPLFETKQLKAISAKRYYKGTSLSTLIWKPLEEELKGVKNIYFSPDGELYNIAIESLPHYAGSGYVFDYWNFHRLSSTRELAKTRHKPCETKAVLYGGLNYDTNIVEFKEHTQKSNKLYTARGVELDSMRLRGTYGYLPGTLCEVERIDTLYSNTKNPATLYKGALGSETSFKRLDGQKATNLHIATHGFYWTESEVRNDRDLRELSFVDRDDAPRYVEDKAMTRSGLLFAGANKVFSGESIPEGYDDGILTAKEISTLDLRGLDLLVLSACQTGLGEIKGDGIYGLQRGFKMAGAQTIVMSLWKVDDDATQMLMTEFYKRHLSGQSKRDAFLAAQEAVRNFKGKIRGRDRNFSDPKYWAGFIILDALD